MKSPTRLVFSLRGKPGYVDGSKLCDADLPAIPKCTVLLNLENTDVSDEGIHSLSELPNLRCIDLDNTRISDGTMKRLATFSQLEEIWLEGTSVSDRGLALLQPLAGLRFISVLDCEDISDHGVQRLQQAIPALEVH